MLRWYLEVRIQLSAEIWMESANPIAVEGRLSSAETDLERFFWMESRGWGGGKEGSIGMRE